MSGEAETDALLYKHKNQHAKLNGIVFEQLALTLMLLRQIPFLSKTHNFYF
jgi:hypothetical protein